MPSLKECPFEVYSSGNLQNELETKDIIVVFVQIAKVRWF